MPVCLRREVVGGGRKRIFDQCLFAELCQTAQAKFFVSYATGGADWYPDHLSFMFSGRNPARTALLTANWDPPESLKQDLEPFGCRYHYGQAFDVFRAGPWEKPWFLICRISWHHSCCISWIIHLLPSCENIVSRSGHR